MALRIYLETSFLSRKKTPRRNLKNQADKGLEPPKGWASGGEDRHAWKSIGQGKKDGAGGPIGPPASSSSERHMSMREEARS